MLKRVEAGVGGDPVQPGAHRGPGLELAVATPGSQVRLLHQVLGVMNRAEHAVAVGQQFPPERLGVCRELLSICRELIWGHTARPRKAASRSAALAPAGASVAAPKNA